MTAIGEQVRTPLAPPAERRPTTRLRRLIIGVTVFGVVAGLGGLVLAGLDIVLADAHLAVYAAACFVLAGLASALLVLKAMLADCQEFYQRGQLDGWYRGYRMQPPDVDNPLLRP